MPADDPDEQPVGVPGSGSGPHQQRRGEDDLGASVAALSRLSSRDLGLEQFLTRVASFAVAAIPGAQGAGLSLLEQGRRDTLVTTAAFVAEVDDIQYSLGQGPCIDAARTGQTGVSGVLVQDRRWPRFAARVGRLGVHSVISLPLTITHRPDPADGSDHRVGSGAVVVGAMNVYAHPEQAFDQRAVDLGELFAGPAAISVQNAHVLAEARRLTTRLQKAVNRQAIIDQAIGVLIARSGGTAAEARNHLRTLGQGDGHKIADVARQIIDEASRRAHTRRQRK